VLFLLLPVSLPVWNLLPKMLFLQFPWRWLVALEAPLGVFVAAAALREGTGNRERGTVRQGTENQNRTLGWIVPAVCVGVFVGLTVFAGRMFFEVCDQYDAIPGMLQDYRAGDGFQGTDEYAPEGAENGLVAQNLPAACLVADAAAELGRTSADNPQPSWAADQKSCVAVLANVQSADAKHWSARGTMPQGGRLVLRLRRYPAWSVTVNGTPVADLGRRNDGLMVVPVSAGAVNVTAHWRSTPDVWAGRWISLAALLLVTGLGARPRRRSQPRIE
jgi:hypothetical protein